MKKYLLIVFLFIFTALSSSCTPPKQNIGATEGTIPPPTVNVYDSGADEDVIQDTEGNKSGGESIPEYQGKGNEESIIPTVVTEAIETQPQNESDGEDWGGGESGL